MNELLIQALEHYARSLQGEQRNEALKLAQDIASGRVQVTRKPPTRRRLTPL